MEKAGLSAKTEETALLMLTAAKDFDQAGDIESNPGPESTTAITDDAHMWMENEYGQGLRHCLEGETPTEQIRGFLADRRSRVQMNNVVGRSQKSVLAPLLFLFYIYNLAGAKDHDIIATNRHNFLVSFLDQSLAFNAHIDKIMKELSNRLQMLQAKSTGLRSTSRTSATNMGRIEKCPKLKSARALRIITGQLQSIPLETLRTEANVVSYGTESKRSILRAFEKATRAADDHPKQMILETEVPRRLPNRMSWRRWLAIYQTTFSTASH
eukprot:gene16222-17856_t